MIIKITEFKTQQLKSYIQAQLIPFINKPFIPGSLEEVTAYILTKFPLDNPHFDFTVKQNETRPDLVDVIAHNLYTGVFLQEGLLIDPTLTEVETLYGKYTFSNDQLFFSPEAGKKTAVNISLGENFNELC